MNSLLRNILLIILSFGMILYLMPTKREAQSGLREPLKTDPVYSTHVFEMELHKDTMPMPFILIWDPNWFQYLNLVNTCGWLTCGGCIIYDTWPNQYPWMGNMDNNFFQVYVPPITADTTNQSIVDSTEMVKQSEELLTAIEAIQARDTIDMDSKWKRFLKKVRKFILFS